VLYGPAVVLAPPWRRSGARAEAGAGAGAPAEPPVQERPRVRAHRVQSWVDRLPGRRAPKPQARPSNYRPRRDGLHGGRTTARVGDRRCGGRSEGHGLVHIGYRWVLPPHPSTPPPHHAGPRADHPQAASTAPGFELENRSAGSSTGPLRSRAWSAP